MRAFSLVFNSWLILVEREEGIKRGLQSILSALAWLVCELFLYQINYGLSWHCKVENNLLADRLGTGISEQDLFVLDRKSVV